MFARLDKDFKNDTNKVVKEGFYITNRILTRALLSIGAIVLVCDF